MVGMFPIFPATEDQARAGGQHVFEGWEYYCTARAQHPRSAKFFTWNSVDRIASFDAFRFIAMIAPRPLFMIVGTDAVTAWMTTDAFANAQEPQEAVLDQRGSRRPLRQRRVCDTRGLEACGVLPKLAHGITQSQPVRADGHST